LRDFTKKSLRKLQWEPALLKDFPARSAVILQPTFERYEEMGLDPNLLAEGTGLTLTELKDPRTWLNPYQIFQFDLNYIRNQNQLMPHWENYQDGVRFLSQEPNATKLAILFLPFHFIIKQIESTNQKFNNEFDLDVTRIGNSRVIMYQNPYPFYQEYALGHECHYADGLGDAILQLKGFQNIKIRHMCCSKRLKNLFDDYYGNLKLKWTVQDDQLFINGDKYAEKRSFPMDGFGALPESRKKVLAASKVWIFTHDFIAQGRKLFAKGEIYEAPFCVTDSKWSNHNPLREFKHRLNMLGKIIPLRKKPTLGFLRKTTEMEGLLGTSIKGSVTAKEYSQINDELHGFLTDIKEIGNHFLTNSLEETVDDEQCAIVFHDNPPRIFVNEKQVLGKTPALIFREILEAYRFGHSHIHLQELRKRGIDTWGSGKGFDNTFARLRKTVNDDESIPFRISRRGPGEYHVTMEKPADIIV